MGPRLTAVFITSILLGGCTYTLREIDPLVATGDIVTLALARTDAGRLEYCDAAGDCTTYPNPYDCHGLDVDIDTGTGATCEVCTDASGEGEKNCESTLVNCSVIEIPDPDCVVCAIVGGSVIYSNCEPTPPQCESPVAAGINTSAVGACETCYDGKGRPVSGDCQPDCSNVACAEMICEEGFERVRSPFGCCDTCVPISDCSAANCPQAAPAACPPNARLVRDPAACCYFYCEPQICPDASASSGGTSVPMISCPPGYAWADEFPDCGRCVPTPSSEVYCTASGECLATEICTTELGDCLAGPGCAEGDPSCAALAVCYGVCRPNGVNCDDATTQGAPVMMKCDGDLWSDGVDGNGCPLPPACHCPDGAISLDGSCSSLCQSNPCAEPVLSCPAGERLVTDYPNCCGICVPDNVCVAGETSLGPTGTDAYTSSLGCPTPACGPGFHSEIGPDCCEICIRNETLCYDYSDCLPGEVCRITSVQTGFCEATVFCNESDAGVDPSTYGGVNGSNLDNGDYMLHDECASADTLLEYWCYRPSASGTQSTWAVSLVSCEFGCANGACRAGI